MAEGRKGRTLGRVQSVDQCEAEQAARQNHSE